MRGPKAVCIELTDDERSELARNAHASDNGSSLPIRHGQNNPATVTGRKSWLFSDTVAGAKASVVIYSLVLTCRACGVEPYAWLRHVLTELPLRRTDDDIEDLMPFNFAERAPHQNTR